MHNYKVHHLLFALAFVFIITAPAEAWDLTADVNIVDSSGPIDTTSQTYTKVESSGNYIMINIREFFYSSGPFEGPWLSLDRNGRATLNIGTKKKSWFFSTSEEFVRDIRIRIHKKRLKVGTTLYTYNTDTGEILHHALIKQEITLRTPNYYIINIKNL